MKSSKPSSTTTQKTELDPSQQALNEMTLKMFQELEPLRSQVINSLMDPQFGGPDGLRLPSLGMAQAFNRLHGMRDLSALTSASKDKFDKVVTPGLVNQMTAQGFGRSGAIGEAIGKAGNDMILPLLDIQREGEANYINAIMGLENAKLAPVMGLLGQPAPFTPAPVITGQTRQSGGANAGLIGMLMGGIQGAAGGFMSGGPWGALGGGLAGGAMGGLGAMQPNRFGI